MSLQTGVLGCYLVVVNFLRFKHFHNEIRHVLLQENKVFVYTKQASLNPALSSANNTKQVKRRCLCAALAP